MKAAHSTHVSSRKIGIAVATAAVVAAGARGAFLLGQHTMSPGALVGAWMMLALVAAYPLARFRPSVGFPVLVGFGAGAVVVAFFAGMAMMT